MAFPSFAAGCLRGLAPVQRLKARENAAGSDSIATATKRIAVGPAILHANIRGPRYYN